MTDNKGANRVYFMTVVLFVAVSLLVSWVFPEEFPVFASVLLGQVAILIPSLVYCKKRKLAIKEFIPYRKISFSTGVLVVVTTYLMYPLMIVLNAITLLFTHSATANLQTEMSGMNIIVAVLLIAVVPACVEEFVFRGVLLQTYHKRKVFSAIMLSAFLFGCMHMNVNQFVYTFVLGIYMAFLVEGTGSILSSMIAHFTLNFTSVAFSALLKLIYSSQGISTSKMQTGNFLENTEGYAVMLLMGILIWFVIAIGTTAGAIAIYVQICKKHGRWEHIKNIFQRKSEEKIITIPLVLAVIITIVVMVMRF